MADAQRAKAPAPKAAAVKAAPKAAAAPSAADWRTPNPDDILVIDTNKGRIVVEMVPEVAPGHVARIRDLAKQHFFDRQRFFRVIENFMAQTGDPMNNGTGGSPQPDIEPEFTFRRGADMPFALAADQSVAEIGFVRSLPVMTQSMMLAPMTRDQKVTGWALYCPGVAGMARGQEEASANSQFFLMRAAYPSLEKRYTAWGRVIAGQDVVNSIKTGEPVEPPQDWMNTVRLLSDIPATERPTVRVVDTKGAWFKREIERVRAARGADFSACDVSIPAEVK
ncbi:peptidylprolyl isomerase [Phenylobacterium sp.]|uniref:peptidylprolyl isomerase n=1 Tax=Phenylobacterium sp. TaxID=1871053 RepID=UPI0039C988D1